MTLFIFHATTRKNFLNMIYKITVLMSMSHYWVTKYLMITNITVFEIFTLYIKPVYKIFIINT